jgi:hypothetical protein
MQQQVLYIHEEETASVVIHNTTPFPIHSAQQVAKEPWQITTPLTQGMILSALTKNGVIQPNTAVCHTGDKPSAISRRISGLKLSQQRGHLLQDEKGAVRRSADKNVLLL